MVFIKTLLQACRYVKIIMTCDTLQAHSGSPRTQRQLERHQDFYANEKVSRRAEIEGEKKYSPPLGTTHSMGSGSTLLWSLGFVPDIERGPMPFGPSLFWPMMGSKPGVTGFWIGKFGLFDKPATAN